MRRVFKTKHFHRWLRKTELTDRNLCGAVSEMETGLIDADLGGGVLKKRVALAGRRKSAGARTLVATNKGDRWFFVFGFEKSVRANIDAAESDALKMLAADLLQLTGAQLDNRVNTEALLEICREDES
jgi:hypothetical protein